MERASRKLGIPKGKYTEVALAKHSGKKKTNGEQQRFIDYPKGLLKISKQKIDA